MKSSTTSRPPSPGEGRPAQEGTARKRIPPHLDATEAPLRQGATLAELCAGTIGGYHQVRVCID